MEDPGRLLLKVEEAADRLGIGRSTVYELVASGELRSVKVGRAIRIPVIELQRWIATQIGPADGA